MYNCLARFNEGTGRVNTAKIFTICAVIFFFLAGITDLLDGLRRLKNNPYTWGNIVFSQLLSNSFHTNLLHLHLQRG